MPPVLMQAIIAALENVGPMTMVELALHRGCGRRTLYDSLRVLRFRRIVHVSAYRPPVRAGRWPPVYALGNKDDATEPLGVSAEARNKKYRKNSPALVAAARNKHRGVKIDHPWKGLM
jgi:hypothetical protein